MLRSLFGLPILCVALAIELFFAILLVDPDGHIASFAEGVDKIVLLAIHVVASLVAAMCTSLLLKKLVPGKRWAFILLLFSLGVFVPFIGAAGSWLAITFGAIMASHRHQENEFWQFTNNADLPFAAPIDRPHPRLDSRSYIEQLAFDGDAETLYNKVVASRHIRNSQSTPILKSAVGHSNERIRLVAYQMLDKKVNILNKEIQRLENELKSASGAGKANIHLQIANNHWELLTLEGDEAVARTQILEFASEQAQNAISEQAQNVNAHFLLGQISLQQGELDRAVSAFETSLQLGISKDKVLPYIAEAAFAARDFKKLRAILSSLSPSFKAYPPLSHVAEFWA